MYVQWTLINENTGNTVYTSTDKKKVEDKKEFLERMTKNNPSAFPNSNLVIKKKEFQIGDEVIL